MTYLKMTTNVPHITNNAMVSFGVLEFLVQATTSV